MKLRLSSRAETAPGVPPPAWGCGLKLRIRTSGINDAVSSLRGVQIEMTEYGLVMAVSVLALVPVLIIFLIGQKQFVQGIASSGIKG